LKAIAVRSQPQRLTSVESRRASGSRPAICRAIGTAGFRRLSPGGPTIEKLAPPVALQELEEMAVRLLALAYKLPPGQQRYDIVQEITRFVLLLLKARSWAIIGQGQEEK
jgi:hypothetical protein